MRYLQAQYKLRDLPRMQLPTFSLFVQSNNTEKTDTLQNEKKKKTTNLRGQKSRY